MDGAARKRRSSCILTVGSGCKIKSSPYTRSAGYYHTHSVSVRAPDRAFYLSSVSNNLVKPRIPCGWTYGRRTRPVGERTRRGREERTRSEKERINNLRRAPFRGIPPLSLRPETGELYADNGESIRALSRH